MVEAGKVLESWNEGGARTAILDFVARVTKEGGSDFVPPPARVAVFDNDGTLWCEQPLPVQAFFGRDRLEALAAREPALASRQPYKAFLERDLPAMARLGKKGLLEVALAIEAGLSEDQVTAAARDWLATAQHPHLGRRFRDLVYRPQLELLGFLRANGFKTFVVTGGGISFVRAFAEEAYGVPPEQVIGSSVRTQQEVRDGRSELVRLAELGSFDDRQAKVQNIGLHIGRRPILAFGNSDGDLAMLRHVTTGAGPRLGLLLHHDDGEREVSYDRGFKVSPLAEALDRAAELRINVVSMKRDWGVVFG